MARDGATFNLIKALAKPGCAVCRLAQDAAYNYLDGLLYENVNDAKTRARLRASYGFCREHARVAAGLRDAFGLAIVYRDILSSLGDSVQKVRLPSPLSSAPLRSREKLRSGQHTPRALAAHASCPACDVEDDVTRVTLQALVRNLTGDDMMRAFAESQGLCLPHFREAVALADGQATLEILVNKEARAMRGLVSELSEFIRKHDYRFAAEGLGAERDAWLRAIMLMVGALDSETTEQAGTSPDLSAASEQGFVAEEEPQGEQHEQ